MQTGSHILQALYGCAEVLTSLRDDSPVNLPSVPSTEASAAGTSLRCLDGTARWHTEASAMAADTTEELEELGEK